jgi:hypothetical protein
LRTLSSPTLSSGEITKILDVHISLGLQNYEPVACGGESY